MERLARSRRKGKDSSRNGGKCIERMEIYKRIVYKMLVKKKLAQSELPDSRITSLPLCEVSEVGEGKIAICGRISST